MSLFFFFFLFYRLLVSYDACLYIVTVLANMTKSLFYKCTEEGLQMKHGDDAPVDH